MMFTPIAKAAVASYADHLDPLLAKMAARSGGRYTAEHLYDGLAEGRCWLAGIDGWRGAAILQAHNWPTGLNELDVLGVAGEGLREWVEAVVELESIARKLNFHRLSAPHARIGWVPFALKHGWRKAGVILEKELFRG